jgi:hypothetical protein
VTRRSNTISGRLLREKWAQEPLPCPACYLHGQVQCRRSRIVRGRSRSTQGIPSTLLLSVEAQRLPNAISRPVILSLLNLHGLLWIGIVFTFLRFERDVTPGRALVVPLAGWTTISLAQLGFHTLRHKFWVERRASPRI